MSKENTNTVPPTGGARPAPDAAATTAPAMPTTATPGKVYQLRKTRLSKKNSALVVTILKNHNRARAAYQAAGEAEAKLQRLLPPGRLYDLAEPVVIVKPDGKRETVRSVEIQDLLKELETRGVLFTRASVHRLDLKTYATDAATLTEQRTKRKAKQADAGEEVV